MHLHINPDAVFLKVTGQNGTLKQSNQFQSCCMAYLIIFVKYKSCLEPDSFIRGR